MDLPPSPQVKKSALATRHLCFTTLPTMVVDIACTVVNSRFIAAQHYFVQYSLELILQPALYMPPSPIHYLFYYAQNRNIMNAYFHK